eukprot:jgi/Bigna1/75273/fgenesh1_pg.33_\
MQPGKLRDSDPRCSLVIQMEDKKVKKLKMKLKGLPSHLKPSSMNGKKTSYHPKYQGDIFLPVEIHAKDYHIVSKIHPTIFGSAYEAIRLTDQKRVLLKVTDCSRIRYYYNGESPEREIKIFKALSSEKQREHPGRRHVVNLVGWLENSSRLAVAVDWCNGGDLIDNIPDSGIPVREVRLFTRQLTLALMYVHERGFSHLDVTPENVMLHKENERTEVRLIDFGGGGKSHCMPPERFCGEVFDHQKCDVWGLGLCALAMASGKLGLSITDSPTEMNERYTLLTGGARSLQENWKIDATLADLLSKIFLPESERLTLKEILQHPFLMDKMPNAAQKRKIPSLKIKVERNNSYTVATGPLHHQPKRKLAFAMSPTKTEKRFKKTHQMSRR